MLEHRHSHADEGLSSRLRQAGIRYTAQRARIWEALARRAEGVSLHELCSLLHPDAAAETTAWRTLDLLTRHGLLHRFHGADGEHRYAIKQPGHTHPLICTACGTVCELDSCALDVLAERIERQQGFLVTGHHFEIHGLCRACRKEHSDHDPDHPSHR